MYWLHQGFFCCKSTDLKSFSGHFFQQSLFIWTVLLIPLSSLNFVFLKCTSYTLRVDMASFSQCKECCRATSVFFYYFEFSWWSVVCYFIIDINEPLVSFEKVFSCVYFDIVGLFIWYHIFSVTVPQSSCQHFNHLVSLMQSTFVEFSALLKEISLCITNWQLPQARIQYIYHFYSSSYNGDDIIL